MAGPVDSYVDLFARPSDDPITEEVLERLLFNFFGDELIALLSLISREEAKQGHRKVLEGLASPIQDAPQASHTNVAASQTESRDSLCQGIVSIVFRSIEVDETDSIGKDFDDLSPPKSKGRMKSRNRAEPYNSRPSSSRISKHQSKLKTTRGRPRTIRASNLRRTALKDSGRRKSQQKSVPRRTATLDS